MSRHYRHYADGKYLYFITSTIVNWIPIFLSYRYFNILTDAFTYCRKEKGLLVHAYVIMPNHFHAIVSSEQAPVLPGIVRDLKRHTAWEIIRCLKEDGNIFLLQQLEEAASTAGRGNDLQVWQEGYHPEAIFSQKFFRQKVDYVHNNPVRKGFVECPEQWLYSSARQYVDREIGMMRIDMLEI
jgi:REP element-mobilizing transposase RayT